jgi:predicted transcriptional regulator
MIKKGKKHTEYVEKKREMKRRKVEEVQWQNTVQEYRKFYKYTKNLNKEYQPINLNVLDVNGHLLSEKKKGLDRWKEYFQGKLRK